MKNIIYFFLILLTFFFSSASYSAYSTFESITTNDVTIQRGIAGTDLNESKLFCESAVAADTILSTGCLWFAVGDVIQTYNPETGTVYLVTVAANNYGWYRLNPLTNPTSGIDDPIRNDWPIYDVLYNDLFFDSRWIKEIYYKDTAFDSLIGIKDFLGTYQGYRDNYSCSYNTISSLSPFEDYNLVQLIGQNLFSDSSYFRNTFTPTANFNFVSQINHCTDPSEFGGISCQVQSNAQIILRGDTADPASYHYSLTPTVGGYCSSPNELQETRTLLNLPEVVLPYPVIPDYIRNSNLIAMNDDYYTPYNSTNKFIPEKFIALHFDGEPIVEPVIDPDSDNDGIPDSNDGFIFDSTNNNNPDYTGIDGTYIDPDAPLPPRADDTTDPIPDYENTTGTASGSCTVAPTCTAETEECLLVHQVWQSGCMNTDTSERPDLTTTENTYTTIGTSFSDRLAATALVSGFSNFSTAVSLSSAICPNFSITLPWPISDTVSTDQHCVLFNSISSYLTTVMLVIYTFSGFRIVASA